MNYSTYFLKFSSEQEMKDVFETLDWVKTSPYAAEGVPPATYYSMRPGINGDIDIVGIIYNNDGVYEMGENGYPTVVSEATAKPGWHVNLILEGRLPSILEEYALVPANPRQVFA
jgi:hypothetical protein